VVVREVAGGAADAAADVEKTRVGLEVELGREVDRRLPATDVEFVDGSEVVDGEMVGIFAGWLQGVEDRLLQGAVGVVPGDLVLEVRHVGVMGERR
jgi:hypothetical protein